jgi:hypothetical protein
VLAGREIGTRLPTQMKKYRAVRAPIDGQKSLPPRR